MFLEAPVAESLDQYVKAMKSASGLTDEQATTCVYYALATYHIARFHLFPILEIEGSAGTGKSSALEQIGRMANGSKIVMGRTEATARRELSHAVTAFMDETDALPWLEEVLTRRYSRQNATQAVNEADGSGRYREVHQDLFGATVVSRRKPFSDVAMRTRTVQILTKHRLGEYRLVQVPDMKGIAGQLHIEQVETSNRVKDVWKPLISVATALGDRQWLEHAEQQIEKELRHLKLIQGIEPAEAVVNALKIHSDMGEEKVRIPDLKGTLKEEFDMNLSISQIVGLLEGLEFQVIRPQGYYQVKVSPDKVDRLIHEFGGSGEKTGDIEDT